MNTRIILSERELISYSKEHLLYEISMLIGAAHLLRKQFRTESPELGMILRNALVESFTIHLRNLIDFLYPEKIWDTDVLADDFFPQGKRPVGFPSLPIQLKNARKRAHKQVSHLTTGRLNEGDPAKEWAVGALASEMVRVLADFVRQASPQKLDTSVQNYVLSHIP